MTRGWQCLGDTGQFGSTWVKHASLEAHGRITALNKLEAC